jgi:hypothetical protein
MGNARRNVLGLVIGMVLGCATTHGPDGDASVDASTSDASTSDAHTNDAGVDPLQVGQVATSCGARDQGLTPVDCTARGDADAFCVFGNHCACTAGFVCEQPGTIVASECQPGSICLPAP